MQLGCLGPAGKTGPPLRCQGYYLRKPWIQDVAFRRIGTQTPHQSPAGMFEFRFNLVIISVVLDKLTVFSGPSFHGRTGRTQNTHHSFQLLPTLTHAGRSRNVRPSQVGTRSSTTKPLNYKKVKATKKKLCSFAGLRC